MRPRHMLCLSIGAALLGTATAGATSAKATGTVAVENRSPAAIKIVGDGGSASLDSGAEPIEVSFEGSKELGVDLKIW